MTDLRQALEDSEQDWPCLHCEHRSRPYDDGFSVPRCQNLRGEHFAKACSRVTACADRKVINIEDRR